MGFDDRIVQVGIEINGRMQMYDGLYIYATGTKYANANQNECEITIINLTKANRDYILTQTTPYNLNRQPKQAQVFAGRVSYGSSLIFQGNITSSSSSQPPDIGITLKCLTLNYQKGNIVARSQPAAAPLSQIASQVASDLGVGLTFQATDKQIANYSHTGAALKQVDKLGETGQVDAYIDNNMLIVKNASIPLVNRLRILNLSTGMIGLPELNENGIKVKFLLDNYTVLGGALQIQSQINPALNGTYVIYKLGFEIANRDTPFYWQAEAVRQQ